MIGLSRLCRLWSVGLVEAAFWLVDLTSIDIHFESNTGPKRVMRPLERPAD